MQYMGSKRRIAKHILPIMLKERGDRVWVEPFVGGGNMIERVDGDRIGADSNYWAIEALKTIRDYAHKLPKNNNEFTEEDYNNLRDGNHRFKGFAGFAYSFGAKWLGGWSRNKRGRDYVSEKYRSAQKQSPKLQGVPLICCDYEILAIPENSLIYCDPPYANTTKYSGDFDHDRFWDWCREKSKEGHIVFVSEYNAPDDFECVWQKEIPQQMDSNDNKAIEKLFRAPSYE